MNLDETQKQKVAAWIEQGAKIAEVQKRLEAEFGIRMTYFDVRLLMDDLKLIPKSPEPPKVEKEISATPAPAPAASPANPAAPAGGVSVNVDRVARPGALVSGDVTFSDGQTATWQLDETGRLGLAPAQQGYKPTPEDVQSFQRALQVELQKQGF